MAETISLVLNVDTAAGKTAVKGLSDEVKNLKDTADKTTPALANATKETKAFSDKATQTKGAVAALAAAMSMVSPESARIVQGLGNVSGALGGVGKAALALGASAGPLAILAVAVGAIAVAWKLVGDNAKEAEQKQADAAKKATERSALSNVKNSQKLQADYKSGKIDEATYQETLATAAGEAQYATPLADVSAQLQTAKQAASGSELSKLSHDEAVSRKNEVQNLEKQYAQLIQERADFINDAFIAAVSNAPAEAKKTDAAAESAAKAAAKKLREELAKPISADTFVGPLPEGPRFATIGGSGVIPSDAQDYGEASSVSVTRNNQFTDDQGRTISITPNTATGANVNDPRLLGRDASNFGMGALSLAGGNVGGAIASLGPAGAIVGGIGAIGAAGAEGVDEQLTGFKDMMIEALEALPEILGEVIPEFVTALVTEVVPALVQALPAILKSLVLDLPIAIAKALAEVLKALNPFGGGKLHNDKKGFNDFAAEWFTLGFAKTDFGSHAVGKARVTEDGPAMLHEGEAVLARADAEAWRSGGAGSGSGGNVTHVYNISGPVGDAAFGSIIEKQLSQRFGPGGVGYSTGLSGGLRGS